VSALPRLRRRLGQIATAIVGITVINFIILHAAPGDVVDSMMGEAGSASAETIAILRAKYGLDRPVPVQLGYYLLNMLQLDFGISPRTGESVFRLIADRLPATLLLMGLAVGTAFCAGLLLGITAARHVNRWIDNLISVVALLAYATPLFWIGLMLILVFSVQLGWLPSNGMRSVGSEYSGVEAIADIGRHLILPTLTLALFYMAVYTRLMRASMLEVLKLEYVVAARAKGLSEQRITFHHVLRNALLPMVTMLGLQIGNLLGGSVLVETVFGWPGLGRLAFEAVFQRDYNVLLGILFISSILVIAANIVVDLLYGVLDPRIVVR
jgi:peptide/nickel transport system permease protein